MSSKLENDLLRLSLLEKGIALFRLGERHYLVKHEPSASVSAGTM